MCSKNEVNNQTFPLDSSPFHEGCPDSLQRKDCGKQAGEGGGGAGSHPWPMEWGWSMWTRFRVSEHNIGEHVMIKKRGARAAGGDRSKLVGRKYSKEVVFMHSSVA